MDWFASMKIGRRLGAGFTGVIALLVTLAVLGVGRVDAVLRNTELILHDRYASVSLGHTIENDVNRQARALQTALITTDVEVIKEEIAKVEDADRSIESAVARLQGSIGAGDARAALASLIERRKTFDVHKAQLVKLALAQSLDEGGVYLVRDTLPAQTAYLSSLGEFTRIQTRDMQQFGEEATRTARNAKALMLGLAAAAIALAVAIAVALTRSITRPISQAVQVAQTVASGDLSSSVQVDRTDEAGQLLHALARMNDGLVAIVREVRQSSESIAAGSVQIATGNADLSQRTERQASHLQHAAASMEEIAATVKQSAEVARSAALMAERASCVAGKGGEAVHQVVLTMSDIAASSKKVSEITGVIDSIAFQTNILALNAAVEAARGGEQGRGFGVVAVEVRTLAQRAAAAAKEIRSLIGASVEKVERGSSLVEHAGATMQEMVAEVKRVSQLIAEIDAATQEQTARIGLVGVAVSDLDQATQQNAALVEQSAAAAESLRHQASRLTDMVGAFKLERANDTAHVAA